MEFQLIYPQRQNLNLQAAHTSTAGPWRRVETRRNSKFKAARQLRRSSHHAPSGVCILINRAHGPRNIHRDGESIVTSCCSHKFKLMFGGVSFQVKTYGTGAFSGQSPKWNGEIFTENRRAPGCRSRLISDLLERTLGELVALVSWTGDTHAGWALNIWEHLWVVLDKVAHSYSYGWESRLMRMTWSIRHGISGLQKEREKKKRNGKWRLGIPRTWVTSFIIFW